MDYTILPRNLVFRDRTELKEFGVQDEGTINNYLFTQMRKLTLLRCGDAKEIALHCFNNAYYICTLIQLDDFPDLCMDKYEKKLLEVETPFKADVYQASMALVCVLLAAYDDNYKQKDNLVIDSIHHWTSSNKWIGCQCRNSFDDIIKSCNTDGFILPKSEFAPRDIIEVIKTFRVRDLQDYAVYICERLALMEDPRQRMYGADTAIARIKDYQHELCEDSYYNPKEDCFNYDECDPLIRDLHYENQVRNKYQICKEAIDYYTEHYPKEDKKLSEKQTDSEVPITGNATLVAEKEQLKQQLTQSISEIHELSKENAELKEKLAEFSEPVENLTAEQKVRMALALELLKAAGLTDNMLKQNKSKVATIMSLLTGISTKKSGTQICQNYLIDQRYYPRKENMETLIKLNTLCSELGINAILSLESQGNK